MVQTIFLAVMHNAELLLIMAVIFNVAGMRLCGRDVLWRQALVGIVLGGLGVIVMMTSWQYVQGIVFDTRSILLCLSGLFFGPVPAVIAVSMTAALRLFMGGSGALTGVYVIAATGGIGIIWRYCRRYSALDTLSWYELLGFGLVVHIVMLVLMFTLPANMGIAVIRQIAFTVLTIYPVGTMLIGLLLVSSARREKIRDELFRSREQLKSITDTVPGVIYQMRVDRAKNISMSYVSQRSAEIFGINGDRDGYYERFRDCMAAECRSEFESSVNAAAVHMKKWEYSGRFVRPDGGEIYFHGISYPAAVGASVVFSGVLMDETQRMAVENARNRLLRILEASLNEIFVFDAATLRFEYVNRGGLRNLGYSLEAMRSMTPLDIDPELVESEFRKIIEPLLTHEREKLLFNTVHRRADGSIYPVEVHVQMVESSNRPVFLSIVADVTERKRMEESLRSSVKEKEILLQEINHRVNNNLQLISSLLALQIHYIGDTKAAAILNESRNRIHSIALVHEKLYLTKGCGTIDVGVYIKELIGDILKSFVDEKGRIGCSVDVAPIELSIGRSITCGLIVNELVSNSLKYAFPNARKGSIGISLRLLKDGRLEMEYRDNGIGLPEGFDIHAAKSLGFQLVTAMAEKQLGAAIEVDRSGGLTFRFVFRREE